jgi:amino acid adenylation domain-containing protein/non-ribosomal peptide synthase protein (TIGR01720 family)
MRLRKKREADARLDAITRRQDQGAYPISFAQERLWFLNQMEPESASYNVPAAVRLSGPLDVHALEMSLNAIVARHEILRASFPSVEGKPRQVVSPDVHLALPVRDLSSLSHDQWTDEIRRSALEEAGKPFDLSRAPLVRGRLLRLAPDDHVLLLVLHHIVFDGWSTDVFLREMSHFYEAYSQNRSPALPDLPIQYADYAHWQREWLSEERLQSQLTYWTHQLGTDFSCINLPADHSRPSVQSHRGARTQLRLPGDLYRRLSLLSKENDATIFMTLLAAFQVLLFRYTSRTDIRVGTPVANRTRSEVEDLIGFFVNTLVMSTDFSGDPTFRDILHQVRRVALEGYSNQEVPFERLVEELNPLRDMSYTPLFQIMFDLRKAPLRGLRLGDVRASLVEIDDSTSKFDLNLTITQEESEVWAEFRYSTDLFERETVDRMGAHFRRLLEEVAANPDISVSTLPMLTPEERVRILQGWNDTAAPFNSDSTIQELFDARVEESADRPALWFEGEELSYRDLQKRANRLAHYLSKLGVKEDTLVGLCLERSLDLVVGLLAILKAGGAYVPLDPAYPAQRLTHMLDDSGASILITRSTLLPDRATGQVRTVLLDGCEDAIAREPDSSPKHGATAENLAYVIYTSGSTGKPKGVMISHRAALNLAGGLDAKVYADHAGRPLRATLNAPLPFDASVQQLVLLLRGDTLYIPREETRRDPEAFLSYIRSNRIDVLDCVPSLLKLLIGAGFLETSGWAPSIVLPGGEAVDGETWKAMRQAETTRFYNMYGPTECAVDSTICLATDSADPSIGGPIINARLYVLDKDLQPLPIGVPGELHIAGEGLGRGYFGGADLTAERFIPEPFSGGQGARMYRTGDLVRFKADGKVEFLGRIDNQVKVRGFRIELGEIEETLRQHETVDDAAVLVREDTPGIKRLVGYVVSTGGQSREAGELRAYLKTRLPDYMIPSTVVELEAFPLTPNGKVDRKALPVPDEKAESASSATPRSPVEELLVEIVRGVLGVERVGIHDSFFDLGGHSLLVTQVMSRVRETFGIELPLRTLFESPTVAELGLQVNKAMREGNVPDTPPVVPVPRTEKLPLSFAQQRLWFLDQLEPGSPLYNIAGAVRLSGGLQVEILNRALGEIVRRHESLRTIFPSERGKPSQRIIPSLDLELEKVDLTGAGDEAEEVLSSFARRPFDLASGPLVRGLLVRLAEKDHIVAFVMHHIISDGWSTGVLLRELAEMYNAFVSGELPPVPELNVQYADYAVWQRSGIQGEILKDQLRYWSDKLRGAPPILELPTDSARPAAQTFSGASRGFDIPDRLYQQAKDLCAAEGVTLFMVLLAAFKVFLYRYSGQEDISVGTPVANRTRREIEGVIGFFVNTLVLRTDLSGGPSFRSVLHRVRDAALEAYAHQEVPFEMVVEEVQPERHLSHSPLFQVMVVLQNAEMGTSSTKMHGLDLSPVVLDTGTAKFDLTMFVNEGSESLTASMEYNTDLFGAATIERFIGHFQRLLEGLLTDPDSPVSDLGILSGTEEDRIIEQWNATASDYPRGRSVHELFEEQVRRTPEAVALVADGTQLSFAELNRRANSLGRHLRARGVGPDRLVGICMERSAELVVSLLGILKAGGAYVPIDPSYPKDRMDFMAKDSDVNLVLSQERLSGNLPGGAFDVVCIDREWEEIARESDRDLGFAVAPDNLAYVVYTSGSTGWPKGVMIHHDGVVNYLTWCRRSYPLLEGNGAPVHSSISFDLTVTSIFAPLVSGRPVHLLSEQLGVEALSEAFRGSQKLSLVKLTPAHLDVLSKQLTREEAHSRTGAFIIGGENLLFETVRFWQDASPETRLVNEYGPTETVVGCCVYEVPAGEQRGGSVPIGKPIINTRLYILDEGMRVVPVGVAGELFIGGAGVARGYLGRPDVTAHSFVPDPFGGSPGDRLYRTGDYCRYEANGNIEFLGRRDEQVKIRGHRVELGEIEAVLSRHHSVSESVIVARDDGSGVRRLVAYIVPAATDEVNIGEIRRHLQEHLPEYMIPAVFMELDELPLTHNGKVDRRRLPAPHHDRSVVETAYVAPRDGTEEALAGIVQSVLGVEKVGVQDNFFDLGGDSILSIQIIARAKEFGISLTPKQLFQFPTVESLAAAAQKGAGVDADQGVVRGDVPLTPIQSWFFEKNVPKPHHWNQSVLLEVHRRLNMEHLERAVQSLLRHHDALRMRFAHGENTDWNQVNAGIDEQPVVSRVDLSAVAAGAASAIIREKAADFQSSLNLFVGPLVRFAYFDRGKNQSGRLLIVVHHLVVDGVSWRILLEDLRTVYEQIVEGKAERLPPKTTSFKEWSGRLLEYAQSETLKSEANYWRRMTRARWKVSPIPVDHSNGVDTAGSADWVKTHLNSNETRTLVQRIPAELNVDINTVLLTALARTFWRWTGKRSWMVDLEGHGREPIFAEVDLSRTVGWFTTISPVFLDLGTSNRIEGQLREVGESLGRAASHSIGFGVLRYLASDRTIQDQLKKLPLAQVSFNYLGRFDQSPDATAFFSLAREDAGPETAPSSPRSHLLDVSARVVDGILEVGWNFSLDRHERETVRKIAGMYTEELRAIISHAATSDSAVRGDPERHDVAISQKEMDNLLAELQDGEEQ